VAQALSGIKVLDLSRFIAGPLCAQMLGDMGAEVIKVERPAGEDARHHAPFVNGESLYTMMYNRNKLGATLDSRHPEAHAILEKLVRWADVLVENYRPGTLEQMGFPYETLERINPRLILTSISGFGQTGPYSQRALFDAIAQAMSGLMSVTGPDSGEPTLTGTYIADYVAGFHGVIGTLLALLHRERTGRGQLVDVASLDALFATLGTQPIAAKLLGTEPVRHGSRDLLTAPANVFKARDGYVYLHAGTAGVFSRLCSVIGRPDLLTDERFADIAARMANVKAIEEIVSGWVGERTVDEVDRIAGGAGIPCGPVLDMKDVINLEQLAVREMLVGVEHSKAGKVVVPGIPVKLSDSPGEVRLPPPAIGEHNKEVYCGILGMSEADVQRLKEQGAI
jgi:crotonobetainyl-CoA:carnitine CoA-transferase CaiB-like acyl-CoA transferase